MERFPKLGLLVAGMSAGEGQAEEIALIDLESVELLYVYGLGNGAPYQQLRGWLKEKPERKLVFVEEDLSCIASFLQTGVTAMLADPQVFITQEGVEVVSKQWPIRHVEMVALPSKQGRAFQALRRKLLHQTALASALHLDRVHGYQIFENFIHNVRRLPESFYANGLQGAFADVPAIVCGAGPSLEQALPHLDETRALIFAGGSAVTALSTQGIIPHFGMAIDPNLEEYRRFRSSLAFHMPLLYSTRLFPAVFQTCDGPFGYMRSGVGGALELWMEEELGLQGPLIGARLSEEAISVTAICVAWAVFLGCNPIVLSGVDLAYTQKRRYAQGVSDEALCIDEIEREKSAPDRIVRRKGKNGKPLHTAVRWLIEARGLSHFAAQHRDVSMLNASDGLFIRGFADCRIEDVLGPKRDFREKVAAAIAASPMPANTGDIVATRLQELKTSLERVVAHLKVLAGKKRGSAALAELDLQEELAFAVLFYDVDTLFSRGEKWERFLNLAQRYLNVVR